MLGAEAVAILPIEALEEVEDPEEEDDMVSPVLVLPSDARSRPSLLAWDQVFVACVSAASISLSTMSILTVFRIGWTVASMVSEQRQAHETEQGRRRF